MVSPSRGPDPGHVLSTMRPAQLKWRLGRFLRRIRGRGRGIFGHFAPWLPAEVNRDLLIAEIARFFALSHEDVRAKYRTYSGLHQTQRYEEDLGELKTLNFEEAFIHLVIMSSFTLTGPIVEIGTQYGSSTRRLLDIRNLLGLANEVICFDIQDDVKHFRPEEARLVLRDVTDHVTRDVLEQYSPSLIYLDAHPYNLLKNVIAETATYRDPVVLTVHDCSFGLCNPRMRISKDGGEVSSCEGFWERYVLAEIFGISNPLSWKLDNQETPSHRFRVFGTTHGLAVMLPRALGGACS